MKGLNILFIFGLILLSSCGSLETYTDYDEALDYKNIISFNFYDRMKTGMDELDEKRFKSSLLKVLEEKELVQTEEEPRFLINFYSETYEKKRRHNIGVSLGTYGRNVGGSIGSGIPINTSQNILSITVEFVHTDNHELFWQGIAEGKINPKATPQERAAYFEKMVRKLLKNYPPKTK